MREIYSDRTLSMCCTVRPVTMTDHPVPVRHVTVQQLLSCTLCVFSSLCHESSTRTIGAVITEPWHVCRPSSCSRLSAALPVTVTDRRHARTCTHAASLLLYSTRQQRNGMQDERKKHDRDVTHTFQPLASPCRPLVSTRTSRDWDVKDPADVERVCHLFLGDLLDGHESPVTERAPACATRAPRSDSPCPRPE